MLIGQYQGKVGEKRRIALPAKLREDLGQNPIITCWYENCLVIVSKETWEDLLQRVRGKKGLITEGVRDIERFILGSAYELEPDVQGRVIIPEILALYAGLGEDIVFLGLGDRVEVWNEANWKALEREAQSKARDELEKLAKKL